MFDKIKYISQFVVLIALLMGIQQCNHNQEKFDLKAQYDAEKRFYEQEMLQLMDREKLAVQEAKEMNQNWINEAQARKILEKEYQSFKKIQSQTRAELITRLNNLEFVIQNSFDREHEFDGITIINDTCIHKDTVRSHFVRIPSLFSYKDTAGWFSLSGQITKNKTIFIDSLSLLNKFDATIGWKKPDKSFKVFRKSEPVIELASYNPYTSIPYINNVVVEDSRSGLGKIFLSQPAIFVYGFITGIFTKKIRL